MGWRHVLPDALTCSLRFDLWKVRGNIPPLMSSPAGCQAPSRPVLGLLVWLLVSFAAPGFGAAFRPDAWFASIAKPPWNPPAWVFAPVWTTLYTLMAVAAWLVWRQGGCARQRGPLTLYLTQLALNAAWTPVFFGLHAPGPAFAVIALLWFAILATILAFRKTHRAAAWLLVPYLAWVSFASALNFAIWRLNP
jgi:benzodiazapine receptor